MAPKKQSLTPVRAESSAAELAGLEFDLRRTVRLDTLASLREGRTPLALIEIADRAGTRADRATQQANELVPPPRLACKEGCTWCCHLPVGAGIPELVRIVSYLRGALSPAEFGGVQQRIVTSDERKKTLTPAKRRRLVEPCPLLEEGRCLVYPVRPLTCRGFNSQDATACERFLTERGDVSVPVYQSQMRLNTFALDGVRAGLAEAGMKSERVELTAGLRIVLEKESAVENWLAGAPIFASARLD